MKTKNDHKKNKIKELDPTLFQDLSKLESEQIKGGRYIRMPIGTWIIDV